MRQCLLLCHLFNHYLRKGKMAEGCGGKEEGTDETDVEDRNDVF